MVLVLWLIIWLLVLLLFACYLFITAQEKEIGRHKKSIDTLDMVCNALECDLEDADKRIDKARRAFGMIFMNPAGSKVVAQIALQQLAVVNGKEID